MIVFIAIAVLLGGSSTAYQAVPGAQQTSPARQAPADKPWPPAGVFRIGQGIVPPRLVKEFKPKYTREAMQAGIEGTIKLEVVVGEDGKAGEVRVTRSLDREFGLDDEAVACVKKWEFAPGTENGDAVPVLVEIEMTFKQR